MTTIKNKFVYVTVPEDMFDEDIATLLSDLTDSNPTFSFISPQLSFGHLIKELPFSEITVHYLTLLDLSDEMWVYGENIYTEFEHNYALQYKIPIIKRR